MHLPIYEPAVHQKYLLETKSWQFYEKLHQININYRHTQVCLTQFIEGREWTTWYHFPRLYTCILSRPQICQLHKSWNFCFAKTWASEQNLGNLESKVRAGLSCSIWTTGNLRRYHWHINLRSYRSICQILRPGRKWGSNLYRSYCKSQN